MSTLAKAPTFAEPNPTNVSTSAPVLAFATPIVADLPVQNNSSVTEQPLQALAPSGLLGDLREETDTPRIALPAPPLEPQPSAPSAESIPESRKG